MYIATHPSSERKSKSSFFGIWFHQAQSLSLSLLHWLDNTAVWWALSKEKIIKELRRISIRRYTAEQLYSAVLLLLYLFLSPPSRDWMASAPPCSNPLLQKRRKPSRRGDKNFDGNEIDAPLFLLRQIEIYIYIEAHKLIYIYIYKNVFLVFIYILKNEWQQNKAYSVWYWRNNNKCRGALPRHRRLRRCCCFFSAGLTCQDRSGTKSWDGPNKLVRKEGGLGHTLKSLSLSLSIYDISCPSAAAGRRDEFVTERTRRKTYYIAMRCAPTCRALCCVVIHHLGYIGWESPVYGKVEPYFKPSLLMICTALCAPILLLPRLIMMENGISHNRNLRGAPSCSWKCQHCSIVQECVGPTLSLSLSYWTCTSVLSSGSIDGPRERESLYRWGVVGVVVVL